MKTVYISGSITADPEGSKKRFADMEDKLERLGWEPFNPRRHPIPQWVKDLKDPETLWQQMMKVSLRDMMYCDSIVFLDGWELSRGARIEYLLAKQLGFDLYTQKLEKLL